LILGLIRGATGQAAEAIVEASLEPSGEAVVRQRCELVVRVLTDAYSFDGSPQLPSVKIPDALVIPPTLGQNMDEPSFDPDEVQFDEKGKKGEAGEIEAAELSDEQMAEMLLQQVTTSPGRYLQGKFSYQVQAEERSDTGN
jgi:hypothetical protein